MLKHSEQTHIIKHQWQSFVGPCNQASSAYETDRWLADGCACGDELLSWRDKHISIRTTTIILQTLSREEELRLSWCERAGTLAELNDEYCTYVYVKNV